ncbi:hypothetical protein QYE76_042186 [Lolium multiflorum]|uniref:Uncharacterized protein n=1 Tax=Lolium multiflorum TaxID=4521 RepID=A0AAD8TGQ9_LOLMU|nr:hypothetical protein QYE76_042186 [Lolium multiflorum]
MRTSPAVALTTPAPPSTSNPTPHPTPPEAQPSPNPAANAQVEVIPVSSEKGGASSSLATASFELETMRSAYKDLESKLMEAEEKRELAEKKLTEKNSVFIREKADLVAKRRVDCETMKKLQSELQGLRNYMTTTEKGWDLLNSDVMEPLGYDEARRDMFPRDDLKGLDLRLPQDLPQLGDQGQPNMRFSVYDTRITRSIRHVEFYDKVVLPADEHLEAELEKEREAEARPTGSGEGSQMTWSSSKAKGGATSPTEDAEEGGEYTVSSPAKDTEKSKSQADDEGCSSPTKEK